MMKKGITRAKCVQVEGKHMGTKDEREEGLKKVSGTKMMKHT
jgi:hypothetical protein